MCEEGGDTRQGVRWRCSCVRPATSGPLTRRLLCGGAGRVLEKGGETGRRGEGGGGACYRQHPRSQSSGRASSCPPSPPQQQPTVAPSFWCACWWATRKRACDWASTMAPSETTSRHRTPARAAASGMRASCRQPPTAVHREAQRRAERVEDTERLSSAWHTTSPRVVCVNIQSIYLSIQSCV